MIGTANNAMVSTVDLKEYVAEDADTFVYVDHELYQVTSVVFDGNSCAKVTLEPQYGEAWVLEVGGNDYDEPMWEVEGQS